MDVKQPASPSEADDLVADIVERWESGGKAQLRDLLSPALAQTPSPLPAGFSLLFTSLLRRHILTPTLADSAFCGLLRELSSFHGAQPSGSTQESAAETMQPLPAAASSASISTAITTSAPSSPNAAVVDLTLDLVWSIDVEIDTRHELALDLGSDDVTLDAIPDVKVTAQQARARLAGVVNELVLDGIVSREQACERLEQGLLAAAGLIINEAFFGKRTIQLRTARLFKQQKFNLLREENEGYSGLIVEVMRGIGPPIVAAQLAEEEAEATADGMAKPTRRPEDTVMVVEQESPAERNRRAARVMNNIQALIGYFDLDANRVLDILLDIFSTNVVSHYPFFLSLLAASPWGRDRTMVAGKSGGTIDASSQAVAAAAADSMDLDGVHDANVNRDGTEKTRCFGTVDIDIGAGHGNKTCAHVLGFKFAHYCNEEVKDTVPEDLYFMAALLIQEGYVRFADLFSHLSPGEEGMTQLQGRYRKAMTEKVSSARGNALSMAAPLTDEASSTLSKDDAEKKAAAARQKEPPNQILGLTKAFLGLGNLRYALFVLTRYPWLCGAYPEVADAYIRLLKVAIAAAYDEISFARMKPVISIPAISIPRLRYDAKQQRLLAPKPRQLVLTRRVPEPLPTFAQRQVFFYGDWANTLPRCRSSDEILECFVPLLKVLGVHLWRDAALLQKLCRLTKVGLKLATSDGDVAKRTAWLDVLRYHLLPALSLSPSNLGLMGEVWMAVRTLSYQDRFGLYGQWKNDLYRIPELRAVQAETEKEAKGILKRISKDNVKLSGRNLAKASHSNPTVFFTVALNQVQAYDNLIHPLVESAKYLSDWEYDIFSYNLIDALSNPEKERTKQDGTNISLWLKSLASFCGTLFKRYAMMDCTPVLQYLVNQLKANNSKDLVIVTELIMKMSGIEPLANLADGQVAALTGGRHLRMEAMMAANAVSGSKERLFYRRSGHRLMSALSASRLAIPLLILVAQQRQACIHLVPESEAHLKYLGNLYDSSQEVLLQYVEFLHNHLEPPIYSELVPSLEALCCRFGIEPAMAFHISRPKLGYSMRLIDAAEAEKRLRAELTASKKKGAAKPSTSSTTVMTTTSTVPEEPQAATATGKEDDTASRREETATTTATTMTADIVMEDVVAETETETEIEIETKTAAAVEGPTEIARGPWHSGLADAVDAARKMLPEEVHASLGLHFYVTFWQLSLASINVPTERYHQETKRLNQLARESPEDQRKRLSDTISQLNAELKEQMKAHEATRKRLMAERDHWFDDAAERGSIAVQMIQHCLFPRALLSATDAIFAGKFIKSMHGLGARNFSSLTVYDKVFAEHVAATVFASTENEARNYSRFLHTVLADLSPWHKSAERYRKEAIGNRLPGFQMRWEDRHGGEDIPSAAMVSWEQFRQIYRKWQDCLHSAFRSCLTSKEYMRIRNAIVIMTRISPFYPLLESQGNEMLAVVEKVGASEQRGDLKVLALGLLATLKARKKDWLPTALTARKDQTGTSSQSQGQSSAASAAKSTPPPSPPPVAASAVKGRATPPVSASSSSNFGLPTRPGLERSPLSQGLVNGRDQHASSKQDQQLKPVTANGERDGAEAGKPTTAAEQQQHTLESAVPTRSGQTAEPPRGPSNDRDRDRGRNSSGTSTPLCQAPGGRSSPLPVARDRRNGNGASVADAGAAASPANATRGDGGAREIRGAVSAARQAALDSMNPPRSPASTQSAQAARDRGAAAAAAASSAGGPNDRRGASGRPSNDFAPNDACSTQPSPRHSAAASRDVSPSFTAIASASRRGSSRAGSVESTQSHSRSASGSTRDRDRDHRERERDRDRADASSDGRRDRGDKERERDRDRNNRDHRSGATGSAARGGRREREREVSHRERDREREKADKPRDRDRERDRDRDRDQDRAGGSVSGKAGRDRDDRGEKRDRSERRRGGADNAPSSGGDRDRDRDRDRDNRRGRGGGAAITALAGEAGSSAQSPAVAASTPLLGPRDRSGRGRGGGDGGDAAGKRKRGGERDEPTDQHRKLPTGPAALRAGPAGGNDSFTAGSASDASAANARPSGPANPARRIDEGTPDRQHDEASSGAAATAGKKRSLADRLSGTGGDGGGGGGGGGGRGTDTPTRARSPDSAAAVSESGNKRVKITRTAKYAPGGGGGSVDSISSTAAAAARSSPLPAQMSGANATSMEQRARAGWDASPSAVASPATPTQQQQQPRPAQQQQQQQQHQKPPSGPRVSHPLPAPPRYGGGAGGGGGGFVDDRRYDGRGGGGGGQNTPSGRDGRHRGNDGGGGGGGGSRDGRTKDRSARRAGTGR